MIIISTIMNQHFKPNTAYERQISKRGMSQAAEAIFILIYTRAQQLVWQCYAMKQWNSCYLNYRDLPLLSRGSKSGR